MGTPVVRAEGEVVISVKVIIDVHTVTDVVAIAPNAVAPAPLVGVPVAPIRWQRAWAIESDIAATDVDLADVDVISVSDVDIAAVNAAETRAVVSAKSWERGSAISRAVRIGDHAG